MKVIFLDIDGVVCLHGSKNKNEKEIFDENCCRRLKEIIDITECKLVLSSSWRLYDESIRYMFLQFRKFDIDKKHFLGKTPLRDGRGDEIMAYLKSHPQIGTYVVLDDHPFRCPKFPNDRLVLTRGETGITEEIKQLCIEKLSAINS